MTELKIFKNELFEVGARVEGGTILFDVEQVAKCLGFTQIKNEKLYIRWETVNKYLSKYVSQLVGKGSLIPEPLVYKLAFKANNEVAEQFQDWLAIEVIPSIRKHGAYMTPETIEKVLADPDTIIRLATDLKEERAKRIAAEVLIEKQKPKVLFADSVTASDTTILVREFAKVLKQNGIDIGEKRLFNWLRENGYLIKRPGSDYNLPTQRAMDLGLFFVTQSTVNRTSGTQIVRTARLTGKGQQYFINKFLSLPKAN